MSLMCNNVLSAEGYRSYQITKTMHCYFLHNVSLPFCTIAIGSHTATKERKFLVPSKKKKRRRCCHAPKKKKKKKSFLFQPQPPAAVTPLLSPQRKTGKTFHCSICRSLTKGTFLNNCSVRH